MFGMEDALIGMLKQVPGLSVLAWLVFLVITRGQTMATTIVKHQEERDKQFVDSLKATANVCHETQRHSIRAMEENTRILGGVESLLRQFKEKPERKTNK